MLRTLARVLLRPDLHAYGTLAAIILYRGAIGRAIDALVMMFL